MIIRNRADIAFYALIVYTLSMKREGGDIFFAEILKTFRKPKYGGIT